MTESRKPLDHWLAPEGAGRPLACLATSFTFEADFFEQQCLARFLGLDWKRGEGDDLAFLIEQEEKLAETRVAVVVDRASATEGRSLRWDLLPLGVRGGVMHAKTVLLVWEHAIRAVIGSANLTSAGYRRQLEAQVVFDLYEDGEGPVETVRELIAAQADLVRQMPGPTTPRRPKQHALSILRDAERRIAALGVRDTKRPGARYAVISGGPRRPVLAQLERVSPRGPARTATVLSPYFDSGERDSEAVGALAELLAARGTTDVRFVVAAEQLESKVRVQAPEIVLRSLPARVTGTLHQLRWPSDEEPRPLHAKALVLARDDWVTGLVGSSNFTCAGLGLAARANLEINVAVGADPRSPAGRALLALVPVGERVDWEDEAIWEPLESEEELREP